VKACTVTFLLMLGSFSMALAHPPRLYLGGSVQGNVVSEEQQLRRYSDTPLPELDGAPPSGLYAGMGLQIEGGLAADILNTYVGFRQDVSGHRTGSEHDRWASERFVLGTRLHVSDEYANPVKPLLGVGISYGWAQRRKELQYDSMAGEVDETSSKASLGWLAEAGFLVDLHHDLFLSFMLRYETLNTRLGDPAQYGSVRNAYQGALAVGLMYQFERGWLK